MPRVRVDEEICTGHGRCYALAPEVYDADETGRCVIPRTEIPDALFPQAKLGESSCPEGAIAVEE